MGMKPRGRISMSALEGAARHLIANALTVAKLNGYTIVRGECARCGGKAKTMCVLCAILTFREKDRKKAERAGIESTVAGILSLPESWVIDMVTGFDNDDTDVTYPTAKAIGRQLWRRAQR
jgi:hypothetical protein